MKTLTLGALVLSLVPSTSYGFYFGDAMPRDEDWPRQNDCTVEVTVEPGDTLWKISRQYLGAGSQFERVARYNRITNPNKIKVGESLKIPGSYDPGKCYFMVENP